ncbi:PIFO protein, partial [Rostratula benghalensis]|nr:PIFO protein [Rostratula benghalensis]
GPTDVQKRISFGSCQERKMFPLHHAPDRLGVQLIAIRGSPALGPGCYLSQESSSFRYSLENKPLSQKGYVLGARTAQRFKPEPQVRKPHSKSTCISPTDQGRAVKFQYCNHHTPAPEMRYFVPVFFRPGTYETDKRLPKKITWPMKFGSPDWSLVPMPAKRMLKMELTIDREFRKHRDRVAYLSLYYS